MPLAPDTPYGQSLISKWGLSGHFAAAAEVTISLMMGRQDILWPQAQGQANENSCPRTEQGHPTSQPYQLSANGTA